MALVALMASISCSSFEHRFYQPQNRDYSPPAGVEERYVTASDGTRLQTWLVPAPSLRQGLVERAPLVLFCHGSSTQIDELTPILRPLMERADVSLLMVSYRGYGRSDSVSGVTRRATLKDVQAAYASTAEIPGVDPDRIAVMGYSLGAVPALALAAQIPEIAAVAVGGVYVSASADGLSNRQVLLFHGEADTSVPPYHALELGADLLRAGAQLELQLIPQASHYTVLNPGSPLEDHLVAFLIRTLHP